MRSINFILICFCMMVSFSVQADTVDNYQIYLKNRLVRNDSGFPKSIKTGFLTFDNTNINDTLFVNYNHCTAGANNRKIEVVLKDRKVIQSWAFPDKEKKELMPILIRDLLKFKSAGEKVIIQIYYFDGESKEGRFLTSVQI